MSPPAPGALGNNRIIKLRPWRHMPLADRLLNLRIQSGKTRAAVAKEMVNRIRWGSHKAVKAGQEIPVAMTEPEYWQRIKNYTIELGRWETGFCEPRPYYLRSLCLVYQQPIEVLVPPAPIIDKPITIPPGLSARAGRDGPGIGPGPKKGE